MNGPLASVEIFSRTTDSNVSLFSRFAMKPEIESSFKLVPAMDKVSFCRVKEDSWVSAGRLVVTSSKTGRVVFSLAIRVL